MCGISDRLGWIETFHCVEEDSDKRCARATNMDDKMSNNFNSIHINKERTQEVTERINTRVVKLY